MKIGAFDIDEPVPALREPHVFAMVRPWVDVGSVGTLTLNRLEHHLGSNELGSCTGRGTSSTLPDTDPRRAWWRDSVK